MNEGDEHSIKHKHKTQRRHCLRGSLKRGAKLLQSLAEHICSEFILHIGDGSQCLQPIWRSHAVANRSRNARRTRFLQNNSVPTVLDNAAATFGRNDRQAVRLRFELRNCKSIRERWKNEYVSSSILFSCLLPRHCAEPFHSRLARCCL